MRSLVLLLVVSANQCLVWSFFIRPMNETERMRRSVENMEQIFFGSYNEHIESKIK